MFTVSEADAAAIRTAFDRGGEMSAVVELRRIFPAITDNVLARECARTISRLEAAARGATLGQAGARVGGQAPP